MGIGDSEPLWGQTKVSAAEAKEHEDRLLAKRMVEVPTNLQMRADYTGHTDSQPLYLGFAARSSAENVNVWLLQKFTYDGSNRVTKREIAYSNWTARAAASYA